MRMKGRHEHCQHIRLSAAAVAASRGACTGVLAVHWYLYGPQPDIAVSYDSQAGGRHSNQTSWAGWNRGGATAVDVTIIAAGSQCASGISESGVAVGRSWPRWPATLCSTLKGSVRARFAPAHGPLQHPALATALGQQCQRLSAPAISAVGGGHAARGHRRTRVSRSHSSATFLCDVLRFGFSSACYVHPVAGGPSAAGFSMAS